MKHILFLPLTVLILSFFARGEAREYGPWAAPINLGSVNSVAEDFGPAISKDELTLYVTSNRDGSTPNSNGKPSLDIWVFKRPTKDAPWGHGSRLGPEINTGLDEFVPNLSADGHHLFFTRGSILSGGNVQPHILESFRNHISDEASWQQPLSVGDSVNKVSGARGAVAPHYFSGDIAGTPRMLFFSPVFSEVPTTISTTDIYVAIQDPDGAFSLAGPMKELNSLAADARPNLTSDGLEIFFYSGRGKNDDVDLWTSNCHGIDGTWEPPTNLGNIVNSTAKDLHPAISWDKHTLFFSSTRPGGQGGFDIWTTTRRDLATLLRSAIPHVCNSSDTTPCR